MGHKSWSVGDVLTASDVNSYLMTQVIATCTSGTRPSSPVEGQHIYETDTDAILIYSGSAWLVQSYRTRAYAQLRQTASQTVAHSTFTAITFGVEDIDTLNGHSTSSNTSRYTAPMAGIYELSGAVTWAASSAGVRFTRWAKNGTEIDGSGITLPPTASGQMLMPARTMLVSLAASDYVELQASQTTGAGLDTYVSVGYAQSTMTVRWLGHQ